jgi:hypothetical protein
MLRAAPRTALCRNLFFSLPGSGAPFHPCYRTTSAAWLLRRWLAGELWVRSRTGLLEGPDHPVSWRQFGRPVTNTYRPKWQVCQGISQTMFMKQINALDGLTVTINRKKPPVKAAFSHENGCWISDSRKRPCRYIPASTDMPCPEGRRLSPGSQLRAVRERKEQILDASFFYSSSMRAPLFGDRSRTLPWRYSKSKAARRRLVS